jgi:hypothetical protein
MRQKMTNDVWPGLTIAPVRRRPLALVEIEIMENFAWVRGLFLGQGNPMATVRGKTREVAKEYREY